MHQVSDCCRKLVGGVYGEIFPVLQGISAWTNGSAHADTHKGFVLKIKEFHVIKKSIKVASSLALVAMVSGCVVTAASPSKNSVVFNEESQQYEVNTALSNSIEVGEVSGFAGTSKFMFSGRLSSNMSNSGFREALEDSLANTSYLGQGYVLDIDLIDSNNWSNWSFSMGTRNRNILVNMRLSDPQGNTVIDKEVEGVGDMTNYNPLAPFHVLDRVASTRSHQNLIEEIIREISEL